MKARILALILTLIVLAAANCTKEPLTPLRVGTHVWPGFEPLYLARDLGYFSPESVRLVEYTSGSDGMRAFRAGMIDAETLTLDEALMLAETMPDMSIVLAMDVSHGGDAILAQPALSNLRDLKGKRVGLEDSALGAYVLTRALQTVDMTPGDVVMVSLKANEHERAFIEERVDAVVTYEPSRTKLLAAGARQLFDSSSMPDEIVDVLVVRRAYAATHQRQIDELVKGWFRALEFVGKEPKRASALMAQREHLSPDEFSKALEGIRFYDREKNRLLLGGTAPALAANIQRLTRIMMENRLLERAPAAEGLIDSRFVGAHEP